MSFIMASYLIGMTIGFFVSGITLQKYGFTAMFGVSLGLAILVLLYFCIFIREKPKPSIKYMPIWVVFKTVFGKRENHLRRIVFLMIAVHCLYGTTLRCRFFNAFLFCSLQLWLSQINFLFNIQIFITGEANVFLIFVEKSLHLNVAEAGIYSAYRSIILSISK